MSHYVYGSSLSWSDCRRAKSFVDDIAGLRRIWQTPAEALAQVGIGMKAWLEAACAEGTSIPKPRYRPVIHRTPAYAAIF